MSEGAGGRPSAYTDDLADAICEAIIASDQGLDHICEDSAGFPNAATIYRWVVERPEFREKYTRAKEAQGHRQADLALKEALGATDASLGRLKWDARRWHASKLAAKSYGDKVELAHSGAVQVTKVELVGPQAEALPVPVTLQIAAPE